MDSEHEPPAPHEHADPAGRARATARLGMTSIERFSATAMISEGDEQQLAEIRELVRATADALASEDREGARLRLLARELALQKNALDLLTAQVGIRLQAGDEHGALVADRLATSAAKRLALLAAEHRASCAFERRAIVAIANVGVVNIEGKK